MHNAVIFVRLVFDNENKYCSQVVLEKYFHIVAAYLFCFKDIINP